MPARVASARGRSNRTPVPDPLATIWPLRQFSAVEFPVKPTPGGGVFRPGVCGRVRMRRRHSACAACQLFPCGYGDAGSRAVGWVRTSGLLLVCNFLRKLVAARTVSPETAHGWMACIIVGPRGYAQRHDPWLPRGGLEPPSPPGVRNVARGHPALQSGHAI